MLPGGDHSAVLRKKVSILFQFEIVDVMWNIKVVIAALSQENLAEGGNKEETKQKDGCAAVLCCRSRSICLSVLKYNLI